MRVGIDTRELMGRATGVGRYLGELLSAWSAPASGVAGRHAFVLYGPAPLPAAVASRIAPLRAEVRVVPGSVTAVPPCPGPITAVSMPSWITVVFARANSGRKLACHWVGANMESAV